MWIYVQSNGAFCDGLTGDLLDHGYAGFGRGKNNPAMERIANVGPLPAGWYHIEAPINSPVHGPFAMRLTPRSSNEMFGRSAFMIHGDSKSRPGEASQGCIVLARKYREEVWTQINDRALLVLNA